MLLWVGQASIPILQMWKLKQRGEMVCSIPHSRSVTKLGLEFRLSLSARDVFIPLHPAASPFHFIKQIEPELHVLEKQDNWESIWSLPLLSLIVAGTSISYSLPAGPSCHWISSLHLPDSEHVSFQFRGNRGKSRREAAKVWSLQQTYTK